MRKSLSFLVFLLLAAGVLSAQYVVLTPPGVGEDEAATLIFDASAGNGELAGADKVYMHHGVVTDAPDGTAWQYVIGNWGQDDGIGEMTPVDGEPNKWQISFTPTIREYFSVPGGENVFRISAVFRSADGSTKGTMDPGNYGWGTVAANQDVYINLNTENFIIVNAPTSESSFIFSGEPILLSATASSSVTEMTIELDSGSGYQDVANVSSGTDIQYAYFPTGDGTINIRYRATINGEMLETTRTHTFTVIEPSEQAELPAGVIAGINYHEDDDTKATLVLEAPGKTFVYVAGDFNDWTATSDYQMKQTPDGEFFWLELNGLTPQEEYVFQYWIDGEAKIGDPYAEKVADPWNDPFIDESTYPDLPPYPYTENGIATVLQTGQEEYVWDPSEDSWERPDINHLMIYELLVRDFLATHSYTDLIDTLAYIKNLGVDAIELMPFNEFEGNESWGYNPNYFFAPDKYYGTEQQLKDFITAAHQEGLAVIMDIVMNHAYGTNPMVLAYFDSGRPAADNPWFNREYVGPFQWGYDWNHESDYTKAFLDRVNAFWIEEYHIDGYRFDFTKGFTNYAPGGNIDGYDQSRIDILKRMADEIWAVDNEAYIILEHWGPAAEEQQLANHGMKMWANRSYDYVPLVVGNNTGSFQSMDRQSHISFFNSHDERRIAEHALTEGLSNGSYNVKDPVVMYERVKMAAAFAFLIPGPKMMWQFDELGYDIDINFNGRVGNKPLPWGEGGLGYYEDPLRQYIYDAYSAILHLRRDLDPAQLADATTNHKFNGLTRRLVYDLAETDMVLIGNFGLTDQNIDPAFTETGTWYDYFSSEEVTVTDVNATQTLRPGEWHIYTSNRMSDGFPGVVEVYDNPVTITPSPFTQTTEITVRFDATKAFPDGTAGLVGAEKVYFHSGVVLEDPNGTDLSNVVGTLMDDGIGLMTEVEEDIWEITLTPADYYGLDEDEEAYKMGMYFRDTDNTNRGMGFRNGLIYFNVESDDPFITVEPAAFTIDDEITITFNAQRGNRELVGTDKVYMHSSVDLNNTATPWNTAWGNVVGNWGADDGVGQMTPVPGSPNQWQIMLTPRTYYGLNDGDVAFWLAAVFRNANGSVKGTGTPGPIENGLIHTNQDFFIRNQIIVGTEDQLGDPTGMRVYPNPTNGQIRIQTQNLGGDYQLELLNLNGQVIQQHSLQLNGLPSEQYDLDVSSSPAGVYLVRLVGKDKMLTRQIVKW
ncbi:MAG: alpha-amylase family glycosyl hydrolase [Bacteroidota bacterium]